MVSYGRKLSQSLTMKKLFTLLFFIFILSITGKTAFADTNCQPVFGGGQSCVQSQSISLQTFVQNPKTQDYAVTLGSNDPSYKPDQPIMFKIVVQNTSAKGLPTVVIT